ncbi:serine incorporator 3 [Cricetulus griseus]|nr:serine incorporator 3 [Cricetulus griseus]
MSCLLLRILGLMMVVLIWKVLEVGLAVGSKLLKDTYSYSSRQCQAFFLWCPKAGSQIVSLHLDDQRVRQALGRGADRVGGINNRCSCQWKAMSDLSSLSSTDKSPLCHILHIKAEGKKKQIQKSRVGLSEMAQWASCCHIAHSLDLWNGNSFKDKGGSCNVWFGAGIFGDTFFIFIQLVLLVDMAYSWNESWVYRMEEGNPRLCICTSSNSQVNKLTLSGSDSVILGDTTNGASNEEDGQPHGAVDNKREGVQRSYSFFHWMLCCASLYNMMTITSWYSPDAKS